MLILRSSFSYSEYSRRRFKGKGLSRFHFLILVVCACVCVCTCWLAVSVCQSVSPAMRKQPENRSSGAKSPSSLQLAPCTCFIDMRTCTNIHTHGQRALFNKLTRWQSVVLSHALGAALSSITSLMTINVCVHVCERLCMFLSAVELLVLHLSHYSQPLRAYGQASWNFI